MASHLRTQGVNQECFPATSFAVNEEIQRMVVFDRIADRIEDESLFSSKYR